mgnify:CR=1 FL=1
MAVNISTLGQQISLINRVKEMQQSMSNAQLEISTGVKHQSYKDYGPDSLRIQRYRADLVGIEGYLYNIETTQVTIEQMNSGLQESMDQAGNILSAISIQLAKGSEFDLDSIKGAAKAALQVIEANMNSKLGDRYLFAGSDVSNKPYTNANGATSDMQARMSDWLDGTVDTATFLAGIEGITDSQAGFSSTLQSAKGVFARVDDTFEVDYTVLANNEGFKDIVSGLRALVNLEQPVEGVDQPSRDDFYEVLDTMYRKVQDGVNGLRKNASTLAASSNTINTALETHKNDRQNLLRVLENTEGADVTDAVIRLQTLQTQLDASYRATAILSQLSLARLLNP